MKPYALAAGAAVSILLASCSSSSGTSGTDTTTSSSSSSSSPAATTAAGGGAAQSAAGIVIDKFAYSGTMTVKPGEKVTVTNKDSAAHTLTDKATKKFDTGNIAAAGGKGTFTAPTKPGKYPFGCTYHPNMAGTLIVAG